MEASFVKKLTAELEEKGVVLVAVSKTKAPAQIKNIYDLGIRDFGENRVQELVEKHAQLPEDIRWHMIGNLQKNKVKYIAPFVHLIQSVSSASLLKEIDKEAKKNNRQIDILLQIKIGTEESKSGLSKQEANDIMKELKEGKYENISFRGFMGMATFTDDMNEVRSEFRDLKSFSDQMLLHFAHLISGSIILSFGMSGDYKIAIEEGSTMVRIGSLIFGARD